MARFILGITVCPLCGRPLQAGESIVSLPFLPLHHVLSAFRDAGLHRSCVDRHPLAREVWALADRHRAIWDGRPKDLRTPEETSAWARAAFRDFV